MRNKIRNFRIRLEMTQEELGKAVGVSRQTINSLEKGKSEPSLELAFKFAQVFRAGLEELFKESEK